MLPVGPPSSSTLITALSAVADVFATAPVWV